jgi:ubiquinone/menaquinone biosynthesis C-methylase UbiE
MGFWNDRLLPRLIDRALDNDDVNPLREQAARELAGVVLEVGFGSGLNLPYYGPEVQRLLAVDPALLGRELARARLEARSIPVEFVGLDGQQLPLEDASVDAALSTFTLCTIPDLRRALGELRRVIRPGGRLHFVEHGRSPEPRVARWQDRLTPFWKRIGGGCHLNRAIDRELGEAGFEILKLEHPPMRAPRVAAYLYAGVARSA